MFSQKPTSQNEFPVPNEQRGCTDVLCTFLGALFALSMFIFALVVYNKGNYLKANYPTDSDNIPCSYGVNSVYSYVYFPNINDASKRVCVSACPQQSDSQLSCRPNSVFFNCEDITLYDTNPDLQRLGGFCAPTDSQSQQKIITNAQLTGKYNFLNYYDSVRLSLGFALMIGIIWMVIIQLLPIVLVYITPILAIFTLLTAGVLMVCDTSSGWQQYLGWKIIVGILFIIVGLCMTIFLLLNQKILNLTRILIKSSCQFISRRCIVTFNIPIFIVLTFGLLVLCLFQGIAYSTYQQPVPSSGSIYLKFQPVMSLFVLNIIQLIWGLQFLKDSFNFMVSGQSAQWYTLKGKNDKYMTPIGRYFKYNFGSVAGGSFLNGFFNFLGFILEAFRCYPEGRCAAVARYCACWQSRLCCMDLIRTDAYSYINLTGIPYCNAARYCQVICNQRSLFTGSQSALYFYRISSKIFCVGLTTLLGYWLIKAKTGGVNVISLIIIILLSSCIVNYFTDLHSDSAQGIQIGEILDRQFETPLEKCQKIFNEVKEDINYLEKAQN